MPTGGGVPSKLGLVQKRDHAGCGWQEAACDRGPLGGVVVLEDRQAPTDPRGGWQAEVVSQRGCNGLAKAQSYRYGSYLV